MGDGNGHEFAFAKGMRSVAVFVLHCTRAQKRSWRT